MPSKRKQINVRLDEETEAEMERLKEVVGTAIGLEVSYSDLLRLAIKELSAKYPSTESKGKRK